MASKKQKVDPVAEHRVEVANTLGRIESDVKNLLANQNANREAIETTLKEHTEQDLENFKELREKQERTSAMVNKGIGGLILAQVVLGAALVFLK